MAQLAAVLGTSRYVANLLVRGGIVDAASLDRAVQIQSSKGGTLPLILSSLGLADEEQACATIADWGGAHSWRRDPFSRVGSGGQPGPRGA